MSSLPVTLDVDALSSFLSLFEEDVTFIDDGVVCDVLTLSNGMTFGDVVTLTLCGVMMPTCIDVEVGAMDDASSLTGRSVFTPDCVMLYVTDAVTDDIKYGVTFGVMDDILKCVKDGVIFGAIDDVIDSVKHGVMLRGVM